MNPSSFTHAEIEELLGAYTLDAVDAGEREAIEAHLQGCPRCRAEVDAGREVAAGLAQTGAPAPDGVWDRIAEAIGGETPPPLRLVAAPVDAGASPAAPRPGSKPAGRRLFLVAAAVAAALVIVALTTQAIRQPDGNRPADLAAAAAAAFDDPQAEVGELVDDDGEVLATVAVAPEGSGFLRVADLPAIEDGVYQLWGATPESVVSLGVFGDDEDVVAFHADPSMRTLMVTHEDEPVERSERAPVVVGELA
jgi:anti-sigma factor RsiW